MTRLPSRCWPPLKGTNEDCHLLARLTTEVLAGCRVVVTTGEHGDEDDFLLRADKNPNTRGARDMGLPPPASAGDLTQLAAAIEAGDIEVLLAIDVDLKAAFAEETFTRLAPKLRSLIAQGSVMHGGYEMAKVLLPSSAYVERHGHVYQFPGPHSAHPGSLCPSRRRAAGLAHLQTACQSAWSGLELPEPRGRLGGYCRRRSRLWCRLRGTR